MGSLIEYLKKKTAKSVLEKAIQHAEKVQECVINLNKGMVLLLKDKNLEESYNMFKKVDSLEGEADILRRDILQDISMGELNPSVRTDLNHLIKRLDDVANCANGVGRRMNTIPIKFWEQSSQRSKDLTIDIMSATVECVDYLDKMVLDLLGERKNLKEFNKQINLLEHKVDKLNIELRKSLQETKYDVNSFTIFTMGNTYDIMEAISDSIEECADYIMVLLRSAPAL
jgi:predicted phosphate transport protein (TIGR00153 family)